jgi:hypothetical protein
MASIPNFDKIINSSQSIIPKRLSFDFLNNSPSSIADISQSQKKRKYNEMEDQSKRDDINESLNSSTSSLCASWETKLLRSDLIEAQSRVSSYFLALNMSPFSNYPAILDYTTQERNPASIDDTD